MELLSNAAVARLETVGHALDYPDKQPLLAAMISFLDKLSDEDKYGRSSSEKAVLPWTKDEGTARATRKTTSI